MFQINFHSFKQKEINFRIKENFQEFDGVLVEIKLLQYRQVIMILNS